MTLTHNPKAAADQARAAYRRMTRKTQRWTTGVLKSLWLVEDVRSAPSPTIRINNFEKNREIAKPESKTGGFYRYPDGAGGHA